MEEKSCNQKIHRKNLFFLLKASPGLRYNNTIMVSSKLKNKGCLPIYFYVLNNFSSMHFVDWKPLKVGDRPSHCSVKNLT